MALTSHPLSRLPAPPRRRRLARQLLGLGVRGALAWVLWPASLGGATRSIVVGGHSMEPEYHIGDIVILRPGGPAVDEIVVFDPPLEEDHPLVVHRIVGGDEESGWVTQGDNNPEPDPWLIHAGDVKGRVAFLIPQGHRGIALLGSPMVLALILGAMGVVVLWPRDADGHRRGLPRINRPATDLARSLGLCHTPSDSDSTSGTSPPSAGSTPSADTRPSASPR